MKREYRNSIKTKKAIRQAFTEILGEKRSIGSITVSELTERADIAKSTFYNHYDDIYAVAEELQQELMSKLEEIFVTMQIKNNGDYALPIKSIAEFLEAHEDIYRKLARASDSKFFIDKLKLIMSKKVFEELTLFPFSDDPTVRYVQIRFLTNACVDTITDYFEGRTDASIQQIGEIVLDILDKFKNSK